MRTLHAEQDIQKAFELSRQGRADMKRLSDWIVYLIITGLFLFALGYLTGQALIKQDIHGAIRTGGTVEIGVYEVRPVPGQLAERFILRGPQDRGEK